MTVTENNSEILLVLNQEVDDDDDDDDDVEVQEDESAASVTSDAAADDDGDIVEISTAVSHNDDATVALSGPIANLCSATLGAGVLSIPYSLYQSGLVVGLALMLFSAAATILSIDMIVDAARKFSAGTYEELVDKALGTRSRKIVELSILLFCEGVCVAYIIAVGDILGILVGEQYRTTAMVVTWSITMLPLSLLRTMESLQWASSIGIFSICLLVVAALQHAVQNHDHATTSQHLASLLWPAHGLTSVLKALPMILFAFSCQINVCAIHDELTTKSSMKWVTRGAVGICSALYLSIASVCLLDFGTIIKGNVLLNYDIRNSSTLVHAAFASMATAVVMAFPLNVFPSRSAVEGRWNMSLTETSSIHDGNSRQPLLSNAVVGSGSSNNNNEEEDLQQSAYFGSSVDVTLDNSFFGLMRHVVVTFFIAGSALALALVVPNISLVFGLIGGSISSLLGFILPGALAIVSGDKYVGWIMVVCGTVIGLVTTAVTVLNI